MANPGAILEEEPEQATAHAPRSAGAGKGGPRPTDRKMSTQHLQRYLDALGLKQGATLDTINTTYYTLVKRFPENPTEEDEARIQEIKRAYDMLRRAYVPPAPKAIRKVLANRRLLIPVMAVLIVASCGVFVTLNWNAIKMSMTHYDSGAVLKLKGQAEPYGQVTGYDPHHRWDVGNPSPAYSIRLQGSQDEVWVGERLVVNGMTPVK